MKKALLIAEKPSLMREIKATYLSNRPKIPFEIDFLSQAGHLVGLKLPGEINPAYQKWRLANLPINVPYQYRILTGKENLVNNIRTAVHSEQYDFIIHAGDADSEGELLIRLVLDFVGNRLPVKRFWNNDTTHAGILDSLLHMQDDSVYDRLYESALVRQHMDYQFGMNLTVAATLKMGELYKLGRVKAAIVRLLADREISIHQFVPSSTFKRYFQKNKAVFLNEIEYSSHKEAADKNPSGNAAKVLTVTEDIKTRKAPKLYKLSTLQTDAYKHFRFSAAKTLSLLQTLYEERLVSYPRTDCEYISSSVDMDVLKHLCLEHISVDRALLIRESDEIKTDKTYVNDTVIAHEGHTGILPTKDTDSLSRIDAEAYQLYELIVRRFLAVFAAPKKVKTITVTATDVLQGEASKENLFLWKDVIDLNPGYELILDPDYPIKEGLSLCFREGEILQPVEYGVKECEARPPARFNDGSIIKSLDCPEEYEENGVETAYKIGTPATRAKIIEDCITCGYFSRDKKGAFLCMPKAIRIIERLGDIALFDIKNSGKWEYMLEQIRHGEKTAHSVENTLLSECTAVTMDVLSRKIISERFPADKTDKSAQILGICPNCGANVVTGKFGGYCQKKCGMTFRAMGKSLTNSQIAALLTGKKIFVRGLSGKKGKYDAYLTPTGLTSYTASDSCQRKGFRFQVDFPACLK